MKWKNRGELTSMAPDPRTVPDPRNDPELNDPRAREPCPLGLTSDGGFHDPTVVDEDGYLRQCACGAWQKGYLMNFDVNGLAPGTSGKKYLVSAAQLDAFIKAGLRVPEKLRDAVKRRLAGKS